MKHFPIELACYFEYCCVSPEEEWRLALYCVNVGPPAVDYLVRHHRIHRFAVNRLRMQKRRKANCNREEDYPKRGEAKLDATYELAHPSFGRLISGSGPLKRIVNARNFFKNIVNCDCLHAKIVAADRLPVVVGVHARTARDASPQGGRVWRSRGK